MKIAKIVPIHKNGEVSNIMNYRPISLLPAFSKVLERIVYNRLYDYLVKNAILNPSQYGFQKSKSTELAILELQERILSAIANKNHCLGIFLDLSKAFDTLNHSLLLSKLEHYGIRGLAQSWFRSYLTDRIQYTHINGCNSEESAVVCGVPQGSILGPLLFLIYINDITSISNSNHMVLFADDTNVIFEHTNHTELVQTVNRELINMAEWFKSNRLSLNIDKTKFMVFVKPSATQNLPVCLHLNGVNLSQVNCISFLGVLIQENMQWSQHINTKCNKISKINSLLYRLKNILPEKTLLNIYNALIAPHLNYGIVAWGDSNRSQLKRLIVLQKKCIRNICHSKFNAHTNPLFQKHKILKYQDLYKLNCCKLYYRSKTGTLPQYHIDKLPPTSLINPHSSRQSNNIYIRIITSNIQKRLLNFKIGSEWNRLSDSMKAVTNISLKSFSKKMKATFIQSYNHSCTLKNCFSCMR